MRFSSSSLLLLAPCTAFIVGNSNTRHQRHRLFGISEWRDNVFTEESSTTSTISPTTELTKPICLLPFPYEEALVQGQTKELRLYEERFIQLFDDAMENHEGVVAMALISEEDEGILSSVPLCEISDYNRMAGEGFGIFLTIKCVGRAELKDASQEGLYIKAECVEIMDKQGALKNVEEANEIAETIENTVKSLSDMEESLRIALEEQASQGNLPDEISLRNDSDEFYDEDDEVRSRVERYKEAYNDALESDTQGYFSASSSTDSKQRSAQELTAVSWAVFSTEGVDEFDAAYRLQALDTEDLVDRLKLGLYLLTEKMNLVKDIIQRGRTDIDDEYLDDEFE